MTATRPMVSVVIPVYQAEACLPELYRRLVASLEALTDSFEIILVEDCGRDGSWAAIQELARVDGRVRGFKLSRNFGQHHAITAGLDHVMGELTVVMDCDLQDKPEDICRLWEKLKEGFDVVIARRVVRKDPWGKRVTAAIFYSAFSWLAGFKYDPGGGSFRIMSRTATDAFRSIREQTRSIGAFGAWLGFDTGYVDVEHDKRHAGVSSYNPQRLLKLAVGNIVAFSDKPLRLSIGMGFAMAGCAFVFGAYIFLRAIFQGIPVPGWSSLITSLYFIGGLILANLGILGIYLAKTFDEVKNRPLYVMARSTDSKSYVVQAPLGHGHPIKRALPDQLQND